MFLKVFLKSGYIKVPSNSKQLKDVCLEHIDVYQTQGKGENKTQSVVI